jgi:crotonobetainyl-CoA:carnitine CoA-transferase CaiB-like acyl-CoA transferase
MRRWGVDPRRHHERWHAHPLPEEILGLEPVDHAALFSRSWRFGPQHELRDSAQAYPCALPRSWSRRSTKPGLGAEAVTPMSAVFSHPQFVANGMAATVEDPELGSTTQVGLPAVLVGTPAPSRAASREWVSTAGRCWPRPATQGPKSTA